MFLLYPELKPYARHKLKVDETHELYVDESGTRDGIPVLVLHSGPGSGCEYDSRCFFNPEKYRIILFDQRGCGRSTPHGELKNNTTQDLVEDLEKIRVFLEVDKWVLFGGGWGSTLGLVYAETYPENVLAMVLRGVSLCRQQDIDWFYQEGASQLFPDHWEDYRDHISPDRRGNLIGAYKDLMSGTDELKRMGAAKAYSRWEAQCSTLHPNQRLIKHLSDPHRSRARCLIGTHYYSNACFLEDNQILKNVDKLVDIPGIIVHGRFDVVNRLSNSHELHRNWLASQLFIVREAGHSATEPSIIDALIRATKDVASRFESDFDV